MVPNALLFLSYDAKHHQFWGNRNTDEQGRARLGPLPAGPMHWSVRATGSENQKSGSTTLLPGESRELELYLGSEELALAIEGRFLDVDGSVRTEETERARSLEQPYDRPGLWVGSSLTDGKPVHPDSLGRFRL